MCILLHFCIQKPGCSNGVSSWHRADKEKCQISYVTHPLSCMAVHCDNQFTYSRALTHSVSEELPLNQGLVIGAALYILWIVCLTQQCLSAGFVLWDGGQSGVLGCCCAGDLETALPHSQVRIICAISSMDNHAHASQECSYCPPNYIWRTTHSIVLSYSVRVHTLSLPIQNHLSYVLTLGAHAQRGLRYMGVYGSL